MQNRAPTLKPRNPSVPSPSDAQQAAGPSAAARSPGRFQYASGDAPLAGFTIKRGVGQGGFGEIYYAQSDAGKDVALKLIRRNLEVELRGIRQCLNLKHPNLIDLYDIRQDQQGDTWVVMEFVADRSLEDVLATHPNGLPPQEALAWIHGIGAGVAYLHDRGIVHRDLKPGNIFCDEGVVKVGDYGLSKFISCSRRSGHTESVGTVHYMAPEVANGRYGKEIDVYALGVVLYELLTGRVPFEGESVGEVLMKHLTAKPDVSMLDEPYRSVVARALEKDPTLRFASAAEMLAALPTLGGNDAVFVDAGQTVESGKSFDEPSSDADGFIPSRLRRPIDEHIQDTVVAADALPEEPVMRMLHLGWRKAQRTWAAADLNTTIKLLILVALLFFVVANAAFLVPLAIVLGAMYGAYWLVWVLVGGNAKEYSTSSASLRRVFRKPTDDEGHSDWFHRREKSLPAMLMKSPRERVADLLGSMLGSALAAAVVCTVFLLIEAFWVNSASVPRPEQFAWLLSVSVLGAWAVLIPSKFWEGRRGEAILRRFVLMVVGMGVGAVAFALGDVLMVSLPPASGYPEPLGYQLPSSFYAVDGRPLLLAHVACFGTVFFLIRWWLQADPLRRTRLSLLKLALSVFIAGAAALVWQFPQPWLPMVVGTISVSVQLASPWSLQNRRVQSNEDL